MHRRLLLLALLWFGLCLLASAPATLAAWLLQWRLPQLELAAVEGSFWRGRAGQAYWRMGEQRLALGRLDWRLQGWSLLMLQPRAQVTAEWGDQIVSGAVSVSPRGRVGIADARAALPAQLLGLWAPVPVRGTLVVALELASFDRDGLHSLRGQAQWRGAQWQWGERWLALGDYTVDAVMHAPGQMSGSVQGSGALAGAGSWRVDLRRREYTLQAQLAASGTLPQEFRDSLGFVLGAKPAALRAGSAPVSLRVERRGRY